MSSLVKGYSYDIFISYRQKDNKGDMWVSEFVEALKTELESAFKEEISVYFDINPHDGLLETHDVDESLKEKLKCLIFIPVISRTYCDPRSFAWEHEFKAFVNLASGDRFGLKMILPDGSLASRVLPVRIYDLDPDDIKQCESVLGGELRSVDFIYRSAGVNRPLRPKEEKPKGNLHKTIYRDQINKLANAISEVINGLQKEYSDTAEIKEDEIIKKSNIRTQKRRWIYFVSFPAVILALASLFVFSTGSTFPFSKRDSVIMTDFENLTDNPVFDKSLYTAFSLSISQSRYINIFPRQRMLETLARMEIKDGTIVDEKTGRELAIREGLNIYIAPSISRSGQKYAIAAKIMDARSGTILKSEIVYAENEDNILFAIDHLSRRIRRDLGESRYNITLQDKPLVKVTTSSLEALRLYSLGIDQHYMLNFKGARDLYEAALRIDTGFTAAKASLGNVHIRAFDPAKGSELLREAVKSVDKLTEREKLQILAIYAGQVENNITRAIEYFSALTKLYPDDPVSRNNLGYSYQRSGEFEKAVKEYKEAIRIDPHAVIAYGGLLWVYLSYLGEADSALFWSEKMISDNPDNAWGYANLGSAWVCLDSLGKAEQAYVRAQGISPDLLLNLYNLAHTYYLQNRYEMAIQVLKNILKISNSEADAYYYLGNNYKSLGNREEAIKYYSVFKNLVAEGWSKTRSDDPEVYFSMAAVSARTGDMEYSQQMLVKAIGKDSTKHVRAAEVLCLQDRLPEALNELEKALEDGYRDLTWLKLTPDLKSMQYDTRLRDLINKYFM